MAPPNVPSFAGKPDQPPTPGATGTGATGGLPGATAGGSDARSGAARASAQEAGIDLTDAVLVSESHDDGGTAFVVLYPNRVLHIEPKGASALSGAVAEGNMIPLTSISGVSTDQDAEFTRVTLDAAGNDYSFRLDPDDATALKAEILRRTTP